MIVVVDGTGNSDDVKYAEEMRGSFCNQIAQQAANAKYLRGPSLWGSETSRIADRVVAEVLGMRGRVGGDILLAGHSRGGCVVIIAARRLQARGVNVAGMFLFDAVDMQMSDYASNRTIAGNVAFVAHARSARNLRFWAENPKKSRFYFYNTGVGLAGAGRYIEKPFVCSHSTIGGLPWEDIAQDRQQVGAVASWMNGHLHAHGLPNVTLKWTGDFAKNLPDGPSAPRPMAGKIGARL